jgi:hypothetical protein
VITEYFQADYVYGFEITQKIVPTPLSLGFRGPVIGSMMTTLRKTEALQVRIRSSSQTQNVPVLRRNLQFATYR